MKNDAYSSDCLNKEEKGEAEVLLSGNKVLPESHGIFLPAEPTITEQTAAEELQHHLFLIIGKKLQIMAETEKGELKGFFIGRCSYWNDKEKELEALGLEGIMIRTVNDDLYMAGNKRGVLYAVSVFLEDQLGVRWFTPDCMTTPKHGTIEIPEISLQYIPPLEYRDIDYPYMKIPEFGMRSRLNGNNCLLDDKFGNNIKYHHFVHTFDELVPVEEYFDEHPEYFSEVNGKRQKEHMQLCLTNPDVLKITIERVHEWIEERPDAYIFSVSQNDGAGPCQCAECQKITKYEGSEIGPILYFVNAVADSIKDKYPDKIISTLAYTYSRKPPLHIKPRPNVTVRLCTIECCFVHELAADPPNKSFVDDMKEWSRVCKRLSIWDYVINYHHSIAPFPNLYVIKPNIKFFIDSGATGVYEEACYYSKGSELAELRGYISAKMLWDPEYDTDKAINEFVNAYYGAAALHIHEYLDLAHEPFKDMKGQHVTIYKDPLTYMPKEFTQKAHSIFMKARAMVKDDPILFHRVRVAHLPVVYLLLRKYYATYEEKNQKLVRSLQEHDWLKEFRDVAKDADITHIKEHSLIKEWFDCYSYLPREIELETLANSRIEAVVLPALGGRIFRVIDKENGYNWASVYSFDNMYLPCEGGIEEYSEPKTYSPFPWSEKFDVEERTSGSLLLRSKLRNGLEMERRITVDEERPLVRIQSTLRNPEKSARKVLCYVSPEFAVSDINKIRLITMGKDGTWNSVDFGASDHDKFQSKRYFRGEDQPAGLWGIVDDITGKCLLNRIVSGPDLVYFSRWNRHHNSITLETWSESIMLKSGEQIGIEYEYELLPGLPEGF